MGLATLPNKLVGVYHRTAQAWGSADLIPLSSLHANYNLVFCAFGIGNNSGGGTVLWTPVAGGIDTATSFKNSMVALQDAGKKVVLSVGGSSDGGFRMQNSTHVTQFLDSFAPIQAQYGFNGVDWDMENDQATWTSSAVKSLSDQLKATYGNNFIISCAPGPSIMGWKTWAQAMGSNMDLFGMQFYDYPDTDAGRISGIRSRLAEMANYGVPPSKLIIGCRTVNPSEPQNKSTPQVYLQAFDEYEASNSTARGVFVFDAVYDQSAGWEFAVLMGPGVNPTVTPPPTASANVTYNPTAHKFLCLADGGGLTKLGQSAGDAGTMYFLASPTGYAGSWTTLYSQAKPSWMTGLLQLRLGTFTSGANTATATFDNVNTFTPAGTAPILAPSGIDSTSTVGTPTVTIGALSATTIDAGSITSTSTVGTPTLTLGEAPPPEEPPPSGPFYTFTPPIVHRRRQTTVEKHFLDRLMRHYQPGAVGRTVLRIDGVWGQYDAPTSEQIASADRVYIGGHMYTVSSQESDELLAAGFGIWLS